MNFDLRMTQELCFSYIGVAAAIGQPLNISVIVRSLGQDMYRSGMSPNGGVRPGLELMAYLDGNLSSNGLDDPALNISFHLPWWDSPSSPNQNHSYLTSATIRPALDFHRRQLEIALIPFGIPHRIHDLSDQLNKPAYTWHSSAYDNMPNSPTDCTRCRLYRSVAVGVMDQVRDTYNMVHACEVANEAEKAIAIRRASGFNELFEATLKKECEVGSGSVKTHAPGPESGSRKGKEKEQFGVEVENLKRLTKELMMERGSMKWTWGVDLTEDDLQNLIRGADRDHEIPHSGYDQDLSSGGLSTTSDALDPQNLEDPNDPDLLFDRLSLPITEIPDLLPHEIQSYSIILLDPYGGELAESEPDPVIKAFGKRLNKVLMQDEVDHPVSYFDYGSEFVPRTALIPHRPWLMPRLPLILPPDNKNPFLTNPTVINSSDSEEEYPDHINIPDSTDSDDNPDHIIIPDSDSDSSSQLHLPISDDEMDVVQSEPAENTDKEMATNSDPDSDPDHIIFPSDHSESTMETFERDPNTGRFTAASFTHFPDDLLG